MSIFFDGNKGLKTSEFMIMNAGIVIIMNGEIICVF